MLSERHLDPPEPEEILCPKCGDPAEKIIIDDDGSVIGCEYCWVDSFTIMESWEWAADEKEGREADRGDAEYHRLKDEGLI